MYPEKPQKIALRCACSNASFRTRNQISICVNVCMCSSITTCYLLRCDVGILSNPFYYTRTDRAQFLRRFLRCTTALLSWAGLGHPRAMVAAAGPCRCCGPLRTTGAVRFARLLQPRVEPNMCAVDPSVASVQLRAVTFALLSASIGDVLCGADCVLCQHPAATTLCLVRSGPVNPAREYACARRLWACTHLLLRWFTGEHC